MQTCFVLAFLCQPDHPPSSAAYRATAAAAACRDALLELCEDDRPDQDLPPDVVLASSPGEEGGLAGDNPLLTDRQLLELRLEGCTTFVEVRGHPGFAAAAAAIKTSRGVLWSLAATSAPPQQASREARG